MANQEQGICDFCKQTKIVNRTYLKPSKYKKPESNYNHLHNEGDYFIIIWTCNDCGTPYLPLNLSKERIEEMVKEFNEFRKTSNNSDNPISNDITKL